MWLGGGGGEGKEVGKDLRAIWQATTHGDYQSGKGEGGEEMSPAETPDEEKKERGGKKKRISVFLPLASFSLRSSTVKPG